MSTFGADDFAAANQAIDTFAPTGLDIDQWLDACVSGGMAYAILTVKHHDGFKLWPSASHVGANPVYGISSTTWYANNDQPDVVDLFCTKCRTRGLNPVLYYSIADYTYEAQTGYTVWDHPAEYLAMIEAEITELLTNYGAITALWLDGWVNWGWHNMIPVQTVYNLIKSLQPNCLMIANQTVGPAYCSEIDVWDGQLPPDDNTRRAESGLIARSVAPTWFYHAAADQSAASYKAAVDLNANIAYCISHNATVALDLQPSTAGVLTAAQVDLLAQLHT